LTAQANTDNGKERTERAAEYRELLNTFDRDLTVTGANIGKHEIQKWGSNRPFSEQQKTTMDV
jgi:hypothetical protein